MDQSLLKNLKFNQCLNKNHHEQNLSWLCLNDSCKENLLYCEICIHDDHMNHNNIIPLKKQLNLKISQSLNENESLLNKMDKFTQLFDDYCEQLEKSFHLYINHKKQSNENFKQLLIEQCQKYDSDIEKQNNYKNQLEILLQDLNSQQKIDYKNHIKQAVLLSEQVQKLQVYIEQEQKLFKDQQDYLEYNQINDLRQLENFIEVPLQNSQLLSPTILNDKIIQKNEEKQIQKSPLQQMNDINKSFCQMRVQKFSINLEDITLNDNQKSNTKKNIFKKALENNVNRKKEALNNLKINLQIPNLENYSPKKLDFKYENDDKIRSLIDFYQKDIQRMDNLESSFHENNANQIIKISKQNEINKIESEISIIEKFQPENDNILNDSIKKIDEKEILNQIGQKPNIDQQESSLQINDSFDTGKTKNIKNQLNGSWTSLRVFQNESADFSQQKAWSIFGALSPLKRENQEQAQQMLQQSEIKAQIYKNTINSQKLNQSTQQTTNVEEDTEKKEIRHQFSEEGSLYFCNYKEIQIGKKILKDLGLYDEHKYQSNTLCLLYNINDVKLKKVKNQTVKLNSMNLMKQYQDKSLLELRLNDYQQLKTVQQLYKYQQIFTQAIKIEKDIQEINKSKIKINKDDSLFTRSLNFISFKTKNMKENDDQHNQELKKLDQLESGKCLIKEQLMQSLQKFSIQIDQNHLEKSFHSSNQSNNDISLSDHQMHSLSDISQQDSIQQLNQEFLSPEIDKTKLFLKQSKNNEKQNDNKQIEIIEQQQTDKKI